MVPKCREVAPKYRERQLKTVSEYNWRNGPEVSGGRPEVSGAAIENCFGI
ncbi:hypothetical protein ACJD0Z_07190 [Flavobacteriaceae bacterium M23B6Z8]